MMTNFMGYGSPERLEQAITAEEGEDFVVYGEGLIYASVCSSLAQDEVVARMHRRLCGTHAGWGLSDKAFKTGEPNPCPCDNQPETHKHYLFEC